MRTAYSVSGLGFILIGLSFILAALSQILMAASLSLLGLVLDALGIVLVFAEWPRYLPSERRYTVGGALVYLAAVALSLITKTFTITISLSVSASYTFPQAVSAVGNAFSGLLFYLSFFLFPYAFAGSEERGILAVSLAAGVVYSVVLSPLVIGGGIPSVGNFPYYVNLYAQIVSMLFGIAYAGTGLRVRKRRF